MTLFSRPPLVCIPFVAPSLLHHSQSYLKGRGIVRKLLAFECFFFNEMEWSSKVLKQIIDMFVIDLFSTSSLMFLFCFSVFLPRNAILHPTTLHSSLYDTNSRFFISCVLLFELCRIPFLHAYRPVFAIRYVTVYDLP